jgi:hypothetical protein
MQQPLTPHDFATFERIALTRRPRPDPLDFHPRVATPRTRKAPRIGLVLRVACQTLANRGRTDHTDLSAAGAPTLNPARTAWRKRPSAGNQHGNDGQGE